MKKWLSAGTILLASGSVMAFSDIEDLARDGYAVIEETYVDGDFEGCDYDKGIPLGNGLVFVCREYGYAYGYNAEVLIFQHIRLGDYRVVIDDDEYRGDLYQR